MANFSEAHKIVMRHEGGYANNPYDRGAKHTKVLPGKSIQHGRDGLSLIR